MWKLVLIILIISTISYSPPAPAADISLSICEFVAANDKHHLRNFLKTNHLKIRRIFRGLGCNGQNILIFAASSKAIATGEMIIGKLSKKIVSKNLAALGKISDKLLAIANKRLKQ